MMCWLARLRSWYGVAGREGTYKALGAVLAEHSASFEGQLMRNWFDIAVQLPSRQLPSA